MSSIITRRSLLRGLFAMPAVVAASSLMPVRGIISATDGVALTSIAHPLNNLIAEDLTEASLLRFMEAVRESWLPNPLIISPRGLRILR